MQRLDDAALLIGRVLMAALFLPSGVRKLLDYGAFAATLGPKNLPYPEVMAALAVATEIIAPIALALGLMPRLTALVLIAFVVIATATSHRFWEFEGAARTAQQISFFKNLGIMGGLLFYFAAGSGRLSWRPFRAGGLR